VVVEGIKTNIFLDFSYLWFNPTVCMDYLLYLKTVLLAYFCIIRVSVFWLCWVHF